MIADGIDSQTVSAVPQTLRDFELRCRDLGVPMTVQRRAISAVLLARRDHPSADDIAADLARRIAGISRATVYRTLETLVSLGLVVRVCHPDAVARYDVKTDRHHHLICEVCGRISDFDDPSLDALELPDFARAGFRVRDYSIHVRGVCGTCRRKSTRAKTRAKP